MTMINRRHWIAGAGALGFTAATPLFGQARKSIFDVLERSSGGRLGIAAIDTGNGHRLLWNAQERFALCSTFKILLAAAVLVKAQRGDLPLDRQVKFGQADLLDYAPVVKANLAQGGMTVEQLAQAAVELSDNSAANLLLPQVGGPGGLTRFIREQGDQITRLDRPEPDLNDVKPDDPRDTTTPGAMVTLMQDLLVGNVLTPQSREKLIGWMVASRTGDQRLRARLPDDWRVGDKTGTGAHNFNDVAIAYPPGRKPILIACYLDAPGLDAEAANKAHQRVGSLVGRLFAQR
ncbi:class A beta-lactamase [Stakelama saccharophila]|uniref:Beta-lactamase n=1 Tax=Stakelama saccharophila TaxID=3075605 RepID=A0ABZ0B6E8_9SPHN|nr:class A beta-lactamase [Stakelama sp. W311]WNO52782.1 class A beta-lactamase [Stakelama sp. W311]